MLFQQFLVREFPVSLFALWLALPYVSLFVNVF
jgi:hypothetical protein